MRSIRFVARSIKTHYSHSGFMERCYSKSCGEAVESSLVELRECDTDAGNGVWLTADVIKCLLNFALLIRTNQPGVSSWQSIKCDGASVLSLSFAKPINLTFCGGHYACVGRAERTNTGCCNTSGGKKKKKNHQHLFEQASNLLRRQRHENLWTTGGGERQKCQKSKGREKWARDNFIPWNCRVRPLWAFWALGTSLLPAYAAMVGCQMLYHLTT